MSYFSALMAFLISLLSLFTPYETYEPLNSDEIQLNVTLISDTHIDSRLPCGKLYLKQAFKDSASSTVPNDVVIVSGDLTNYGDEASIVDFFEIMTEYSNASCNIVAMGNHDIGHVEDLGFTNQEARNWFLKHHNNYLDTDHKNNYYSYTVKGYKFIVLCDDSEDNWDEFEIHEEQTAFLDKELADASKNGLPSFVVCHEPTVGQNGQAIVHDGGSMQPESSERIRAVMEKYENVFYISGHMHEGINGDLMNSIFGFRNIETVNGVTYISLPSYLLFNRFGFLGNGLGMQMEVYEDEIIFRARNFSISEWYGDYTYSVPLV